MALRANKEIKSLKIPNSFVRRQKKEKGNKE